MILRQIVPYPNPPHFFEIMTIPPSQPAQKHKKSNNSLARSRNYGFDLGIIAFQHLNIARIALTAPEWH
jgi:hypothetical protein